VGDESCASCSSSLNLKLCSVCEAINAHSAKRCHSCKAEFGSEPEVATTLEADAPPRQDEAPEAAPAGRTLPAAWRSAAEESRRSSTKSAVALWVLPLVAAAAAYYLYDAVSQPARKPQVAQKLEATQKSAEPASQAQAAPHEPAKPQTTEVKQPQAPAVSGKISAPKTAPAPLPRVAPSATETKRATAGIPHAAAAAAAPPAAIPDSRRVAVTHTKAALTEAAAATTPPAAAASEGRSAVAETRNDEPAGCTAAVAALGLCKSK
jgi:hypothetical protein